MSQQNIFDGKIPLPDARLAAREKTLLGFDARYQKIHDQLRLLLNLGELATWSKKHHRQKLAICDLVTHLQRPARTVAALRWISKSSTALFGYSLINAS